LRSKIVIINKINYIAGNIVSLFPIFI